MWHIWFKAGLRCTAPHYTIYDEDIKVCMISGLIGLLIAWWLANRCDPEVSGTKVKKNVRHKMQDEDARCKA